MEFKKITIAGKQYGSLYKKLNLMNYSIIR